MLFQKGRMNNVFVASFLELFSIYCCRYTLTSFRKVFLSFLLVSCHLYDINHLVPLDHLFIDSLYLFYPYWYNIFGISPTYILFRCSCYYCLYCNNLFSMNSIFVVSNSQFPFISHSISHSYAFYSP